MKKLLVMAIGLGLALGTVSFAQTSSTDTTKTDKKAKKSKKADTTSTDKKM
jgi:hypothetical protein